MSKCGSAMVKLWQMRDLAIRHRENQEDFYHVDAQKAKWRKQSRGRMRGQTKEVTWFPLASMA